MFSGSGYYRTKEGIYEGNFSENHKNGLGKFIWNENKFYEGNWENGKQHGEGVFTKNGQIFKGIWKNGKFQKNDQTV